MEHSYLENSETANHINKFYEELKTFDGHSLVAAYNNKKKVVGVKAQTLYLIALSKVFKERFGKSPIELLPDLAVELTGPIFYMETLDDFGWFRKN
jgi:hypothetical protein